MGASIAPGSARTFRLIRRETSLRRSGRPSDVSFCTESLCRSRPAFYVHAVIERYSRAPMRELWSEQRKFEIWLEIETLACEAMAEIGQIPPADAAEIRQRARFSIPEINEIEKRTNHDVIAFLENVATSVGPAARWIHQGLTSSDILDTTLAVQLVAAGKILLEDIRELRRVVADQARRYKMTPMIGRSHGIHAEPITFGLKLALMFDEFGRAEERLSQTLGACRRRQTERRRRHACASRPADRAPRLREARAAAGETFHPDHSARSARGIFHHSRAHCVEHRSLGHRVAASAANRSARSGGVF